MKNGKKCTILPPIMKRNITTKEIAKMANVSIGTVDRVIHNRSGVAEKTREKILTILDEVDYEPNLYARNLVRNKIFKIAVLLPKYGKDDYWELPIIGVTKAIKEFSRHGLEIEIHHFEQKNTSNFTDQANSIISNKIDALVFAPVFIAESLSLTNTLVEKEIPYVLIDANLPDVHPLTFIGQNAFQSGHLAAKLMLMLNNKGENIIINLLETVQNNIILKRIEGYEAYFKENNLTSPTLKIVETHNGMELEGFLLTRLEKKMALNIFIPNSRAFLVSHIKEKHKIGAQINIIGFDLLKENIDGLSKGLIQFIIHQKPEIQGYKAIEVLYKTLILNEKVEELNYMPIDIITKENVEFFE